MDLPHVRLCRAASLLETEQLELHREMLTHIYGLGELGYHHGESLLREVEREFVEADSILDDNKGGLTPAALIRKISTNVDDTTGLDKVFSRSIQGAGGLNTNRVERFGITFL